MFSCERILCLICSYIAYICGDLVRDLHLGWRSKKRTNDIKFELTYRWSKTLWCSAVSRYRDIFIKISLVICMDHRLLSTQLLPWFLLRMLTNMLALPYKTKHIKAKPIPNQRRRLSGPNAVRGTGFRVFIYLKNINSRRISKCMENAWNAWLCATNQYHSTSIMHGCMRTPYI